MLSRRMSARRLRALAAAGLGERGVEEPASEPLAAVAALHGDTQEQRICLRQRAECRYRALLGPSQHREARPGQQRELNLDSRSKRTQQPHLTEAHGQLAGVLGGDHHVEPAGGRPRHQVRHCPRAADTRHAAGRQRQGADGAAGDGPEGQAGSETLWLPDPDDLVRRDALKRHHGVVTTDQEAPL